jgi:hypothetical protein
MALSVLQEASFVIRNCPPHWVGVLRLAVWLLAACLCGQGGTLRVVAAGGAAVPGSPSSAGLQSGSELGSEGEDKPKDGDDDGEGQVGQDTGFSDSFVHRRFLPWGAGQWSGSTAQATFEAEEPRHGGKRGGRSMWGAYMADADGVLILSTEGSRFDTMLGVYKVDGEIPEAGFQGLAQVGFGDDEDGGRLTSKVVVPVKAGVEYAIVVDGFAGAAGDVVVSWSFVKRSSPPPSVVWVSASRSVALGEQVVLAAEIANSAGAEFRWVRNGELVAGGGTSANLVLPSFTAADVGRYRLRVRVQDVELYSDWVELQLNTETGWDAGARDKVYDALGSPLRAEVAPVSAAAGAMGRGRGGARLQGLPVGVVRGMNGTQVFSTVGATRDPDEPLHCGEAGGASYWFAYEAAAEGTLRFDAEGTAFPAVLAAYTFDGVLESYSQLISVACDVADSSGGAPAVEFRTLPGRTYLVVLDGVGGARGVARLNYRFAPDGPPVVARSPESAVVIEGQPLLLSVGVTGTPPFGLQWRRDGVAIAGATGLEYRVDAVADADGGRYWVEVTNRVGGATSEVAVVQVLLPPAIQAPLLSQVVDEGGTATFLAGVGGSPPLEIRWFFNGSELAGRSGVSLSVGPVSAADVGEYRFVASNGAGSVTSVVARLDMGRAPVIVGFLRDRWIEAGAPVSIEAEVSGSEPMGYRWYRFGAEIPGQTSRNLVLSGPTAADTGSYHFVASNPFGTVVAASAWMEVVRRPELDAPLAARQVATGSSVVWRAAVRGDPPMSFRWFRDGIQVAGVNGGELVLSGVTALDAGEYSFEVLNPVGTTSSPPARLDVLQLPTASVVPPLARRLEGDGVEFTAVMGGDGPFEVQWYRGLVPVAGATGPVLVLTNLSVGDAGEYRVEVSNPVGVATNGVAGLDVVPALQVELAASGTVVRAGDEAELEALVTGGGEVLAFRWYREGVLLPGATRSVVSWSPVRLSDAGRYRLEVETDLAGVRAVETTLRVAEPVRLVEAPTPQEVAVGAQVVLKAAAAGTPPLRWAWRRDGEVLGNQTNATLAIGAAEVGSGGVYRVTVANEVSSLESGPATLVVVTQPRILASPASLRVGRGGVARLTVRAEVSGGTRISWMKDGRVVEGLTGGEIVLEDCGPGDVGEYSAEVENVAGSVRSAPARLEVLERTGIWLERETGRVVLGLLVPRGDSYRVEASSALDGVWEGIVDGVGTESGLAEFPFPVGGPGSRFLRYVIGTGPGLR